MDFIAVACVYNRLFTHHAIAAQDPQALIVQPFCRPAVDGDDVFAHPALDGGWRQINDRVNVGDAVVYGSSGIEPCNVILLGSSAGAFCRACEIKKGTATGRPSRKRYKF